MQIKPGDFITHGGCSILFEVESVLNSCVICAARDPKVGTDLIFKTDIRTCQEKPTGHWIMVNREKNFYDKFFPEGWQPTITEVVAFEDIKEGMKLITEKGVCIAERKVNNTWHLKGAKKTFTSKNNDSYVSVLIQAEGKIND